MPSSGSRASSRPVLADWQLTGRASPRATLTARPFDRLSGTLQSSSGQALPGRSAFRGQALRGPLDKVNSNAGILPESMIAGGLAAQRSKLTTETAPRRPGVETDWFFSGSPWQIFRHLQTQRFGMRISEKSRYSKPIEIAIEKEGRRPNRRYPRLYRRGTRGYQALPVPQGGKPLSSPPLQTGSSR